METEKALQIENPDKITLEEFADIWHSADRKFWKRVNDWNMKLMRLLLN